jgi:6-phosphogluconolactonase
MDGADVRILADREELSRAAAEEFARLAGEAVRIRGRFAVALSGGSTPRALHHLLSDEGAGFPSRIPWNDVHIFWGDERHVPPAHPESNYRMARETLLTRVPLPLENLHRIPAENPDAAKAADEYAQTLRTFFGLSAGELPRFDLILLGMGPDGHTASLFPGTDAVHEKIRLVAAPWVGKLGARRITLTPAVLNNAARVLFLVSGEGKAETLRAVLEGPYQPDRFPAQIVRPVNGRLTWIVDRAAACRLRQSG